MKKIFSFILIISLILSLFSFTAYASENNVRVEELSLSLSIPDSYSIIDKNTPETDSIFGKLGISKNELLYQLKEKNIYLNCISKGSNEEIVVTMVKNSISDFNLLSDTSLKAFASTLVDQCKNYNIDVSKYDIYQQNQAKFIKVYFHDSSQSAYGLQYYTIFDNKAMNFTLRSYNGKISSAQENTISKIVDSIQFDAKPQKHEEGSETESFAYEDNDAGINFTVPNNWKKEPLSKERQFIDVKFASTKEDGLSILFGATDLWSQLSSSEKLGTTREEFDDTQLSTADIAEMLNLDSTKVSEKTFNNIHFYLSEVTSTSEVYGMNVTVTMTHANHIQNGWMYWFQFAATKESPYYTDFETMLNSVYIQGVAINDNYSLGSLGNNNGTDLSNSTTSFLWIVLIVIAVVILSFVLLRKKKTNKRNIAVDTPPIIEPTVNKDLNTDFSNTKDYCFCHRCGAKLNINVQFCHKCGTKIKR